MSTGKGVFSITGRVITVIDDVYGNEAKPKRTLVIGTDNGWMRDGQYQNRPQQIPVEFVGVAVDATMQVQEGDLVVVTGRPSGREYQDRFYCNLEGRDVSVLVSGYVPESGHIPVQETGQNRESPASAADDDLPF